MNRKEHDKLIAFLFLFLILATTYNFISTPYEAPDEMGHFYYVVHLLRTRELPVVPASVPMPHYEQEGTQAPLYYLTGALLVRVLEKPLRLDWQDVNAPFVINPHTVCSQPHARYNVTALAHDPHAETFPYTGRVRTLHLLRLWSTLLATGIVAGVLFVTRLVFPQQPRIAWLAAGITAFTPEFLFTAAAVNNDLMVTLLVTWSLYVALRLLRDGLAWSQTLILAVLVALAALSKLGGLMLLPLAGAAILLSVYLQHRDRRPADCLRAALPHWIVMIALFTALAGWWYVRNWHLYGDPTAVSAHLAVMPVRETMSWAIFLQELPGLFYSWWGVLGCTLPPSGFYVFYLLLVIGGLSGLWLNRQLLASRWPHILLLLMWFALMWAGYMRWNWAIHAAKGRLLYPTLPVVTGLLGCGWDAWNARWRGTLPILLGAFALLASLAPFVIMAPPVIPPPIYDDTATVAPQQVLDGQFGDTINLLGYDLPQTSFEPGDDLPITLYWHALARPDRHYTLALQLVSAIPGDTNTLVNFNTWSGGGNFPTGMWRPGDVIVDRYRLHLPDNTPQAQGWLLQLVLYDLETMERLPYAVANVPAGDHANLALLRVGAADSTLDAPEAASQVSGIIFGQVIELEAGTVDVSEGSVTLTLWWRGLATLPNDLTLFVHLYDETGQLLVAGDGPPLDGGFPTSLWQPGDRVRFERTLPLPVDGTSPNRLGIGWYNPQDGTRLPAVTTSNERLQDDVFYLSIPTVMP